MFVKKVMYCWCCGCQTYCYVPLYKTGYIENLDGMTYRPNTETENIVRENNFSRALQNMKYKFELRIVGEQLIIRLA